MTQPLQAGVEPQLATVGQVAVLRLCRPAQANRLEPGDLEVLLEHFQWLKENLADVRALVLTGTGKHFSAGFDLGAIDAAVEGNASNRFAEMVDALEALPQTTVCALNGGVFGGSTDLALACDFRLGVPATRMFMPAARFGLPYYASGLRRYVTRLGLNSSKRLFMLSEEIDAQELLNIGYLTQVVPAESLQDEALAVARRAAALGPLAIAATKAALNAMAAGYYDAEEGAKVYRACMASADLQEGIAALREKRAPQFEAR